MKPELLKELPKMTSEKIAKLNEIYLMLENGTTKQEIAKRFNFKNERIARDYINYIKNRYPVISHSGKKGYRFATNQQDLEEAHRTISEIESRQRELEETKKPLIQFVKKFEI